MKQDSKKYFILSVCLFFCLAFVTGCGSRQTAFHPRQFPSVNIPSVVSGNDAAEYAVYYFWDSFTDTSVIYPSDSSLINGVLKADFERSFYVWASAVADADMEKASKAVGRLFDRISLMEHKDSSSNVLEAVGDMMGKYFYDPNSQLRNEDIYGEFAVMMSGSDIVSEERRGIYSYEAGMCNLNRTGTAAADFVFCDSKGRTKSLYDINSEYTLLFFSNPGCAACRQIISVLEENEKFNFMVESGRLAVVNVYIDEELDEWYKYLNEYPEKWFNGYDPEYVIRTDLLYNVRAIPSLYLLDKYKTVILKDAPENKIFAVLDSLE